MGPQLNPHVKICYPCKLICVFYVTIKSTRWCSSDKVEWFTVPTTRTPNGLRCSSIRIMEKVQYLLGRPEEVGTKVSKCRPTLLGQVQLTKEFQQFKCQPFCSA